MDLGLELALRIWPVPITLFADSVSRDSDEKTNDSGDPDDGNNEHASDSIKSKLEL